MRERLDFAIHIRIGPQRDGRRLYGQMRPRSSSRVRLEELGVEKAGE